MNICLVECLLKASGSRPGASSSDFSKEVLKFIKTGSGFSKEVLKFAKKT